MMLVETQALPMETQTQSMRIAIPPEIRQWQMGTALSPHLSPLQGVLVGTLPPWMRPPRTKRVLVPLQALHSKLLAWGMLLPPETHQQPATSRIMPLPPSL